MISFLKTVDNPQVTGCFRVKAADMNRASE